MCCCCCSPCCCNDEVSHKSEALGFVSFVNFLIIFTATGASIALIYDPYRPDILAVPTAEPPANESFFQPISVKSAKFQRTFHSPPHESIHKKEFLNTRQVSGNFTYFHDSVVQDSFDSKQNKSLAGATQYHINSSINLDQKEPSTSPETIRIGMGSNNSQKHIPGYNAPMAMAGYNTEAAKKRRREKKLRAANYTRSRGTFTQSHLPPPVEIAHLPMRQDNRIAMFFFLSIVFMILWSYWRAYLTDPGGVEDWERERPDLVPGESSDGEEEATRILTNRTTVATSAFHMTNNNKDEILNLASEGESSVKNSKAQTETENSKNFCKYCQIIKPKRVHHCRDCRKCILRMDHHCPWIGNCVGFGNHKFFFLFLYYATTGTACSLFIFFRFLYHSSLTRNSFKNIKATVALSVFVPVGILISIGTVIGTGVLFGWNVYICLNNMTTIEHFKYEKGDRSVLIYNKGAFKNIQHLLGRNPILWFLPIRDSRKKNNLCFPYVRISGLFHV